jgi:hypothetical protein
MRLNSFTGPDTALNARQEGATWQTQTLLEAGFAKLLCCSAAAMNFSSVSVTANVLRL